MKETSNSGLLALGIAVLAVVSGGWLYFYSPLESQRPDQQSRDHGGSPVSTTVRARLWQDPFEPVQSHWDRITSYMAANGSVPPDIALPMTIGELATFATREWPSPRLRLVVLLPGGPYAEDVEQRRRHRYAVISALTEAEYVPNDGERIGYFVAPSFSPEERQRSATCAPARAQESDRQDASARRIAVQCFLESDSVVVAYESFKPSAKLKRSRNHPHAATADVRDLRADWKWVLVLWVYEEDTLSDFPSERQDGGAGGGGSPLRAVVQLLTALDLLHNGVADGSDKNVRTVVLGPSSSAMLARMYRELRTDKVKEEAIEAGVDFVNEAERYRANFRDLVFGGGPAILREEPTDSLPRAWATAQEIEAQIIEDIVDSIDSYLDHGLPLGGHQQLSGCLARREELLTCLKRLSPELTDSDVEWQQTVTRWWEYSPEIVANWIAQAAATPDPSNLDPKIVDLLLLLHGYLDHGLEQIEKPQELGTCLRDATETAVAADCLRIAMRKVVDSDTNWAALAGLWWETLPAREVKSESAAGSAARETLERGIRSRLGKQREELVVLSPRATAPLHMLLPDGRDGISDEDVTKKMDIAQFRSVIASDDRVLRNVLLELDARGAWRGDTRTILIVAEQDTEYARFMGNIVAEQAEILALQGDDGRARALGSCPQKARVGPQDGLSCTSKVIERTYLRGVDGEIPPRNGTGERRNAAEIAAVEAPDRSFRTTARPERAYGVAQLDYIRRLADDIARPRLGDEELANVVAVGVLGSDVYDKLLVLQSLRQRLPWLTFFTTDLDARLSDTDALDWTKNLLVASAYPLSLPGRKGPPFRDGYQTALYQAVEYALRIDGDGDMAPGQLAPADIPGPPPPRLFEIGRNGPVDITPGTGRSACTAVARAAGPTSAGLLGGTLLLLSPLFALAVATARLARQTSREGYSRWHAALVHVSWAAGIAALAIGLLLTFWNALFEEPWLPQHGITSVPAIALYLTTMAFAACLLRLAFGRIEQWNGDTTDTFGLPSFPADHAETAEAASSERTGARRWLSAATRLHEARTISAWQRELNGSAKTARSQADTKQIWRRYLALGALDARLWRVLPLTVLWSGVAILIVHVEPAPLLTRGVHVLLDAVRYGAIVATLGTVFFCTDALHLGQMAIRALATHDADGWAKDHTTVDSYAWRRLNSMRLIVDITETIGPVVVFPFILLVLLIVARSSFFEGWVWTPNLILLYAAFSAHILLRALRFQFEAASSRDRILRDLAGRRMELAHDDAHLRWLNSVIDEVDAIRRGAFVPWTRHPILQSIALPSGGIGLVSIANAMLG